MPQPKSDHWTSVVWGSPPDKKPEQKAAPIPSDLNTPAFPISGTAPALPNAPAIPQAKTTPTDQKRGEEAEARKSAAPDGEINKEALRQKILVTDLDEVSFDDIKGQDKAVTEVKALANRLEQPKIYRLWGSEDKSGVLLIGPPGTGKTMLGKALATSAKYAFLVVTCADINNMFFGNAEKMAEAVFEIAAEEAAKHPSGHVILFLDEVEALLKDRSGPSAQGSENVLSIFLTSINGLQKNGSVLVFAATNRPDMLDSAFLSRMDTVIEVPLPDAKGVSAILEGRIHSASKRAGRTIYGEIDYTMLGELLHGFSGRDIKNLVNAVTTAKADEHTERINKARAAIAKDAPFNDEDPAFMPAPISTLDILVSAASATKTAITIGPEGVSKIKEKIESIKKETAASTQS